MSADQPTDNPAHVPVRQYHRKRRGKGRPSRINPIRDEIAEFYRAGHSLLETTEHFKTGKRQLRKLLKDLGIEIRPKGEAQTRSRLVARANGKPRHAVPSLLDPIKDEVIGFYHDGHSLYEVGQRFGINATSTKKFLLKHGVSIRPRAESLRLTRARGIGARKRPEFDPARYTDRIVLPNIGVGHQIAFAFDGLDGYKSCPRCKLNLPIDAFYLRDGKPYNIYCKICWKQYTSQRVDPGKARDRQQKHRLRWPERGREQRTQLRNEILIHYGGRCQCCGETAPEFLAVDHVHGDGAEHRRMLRARGINPSGEGLCRWIKRNNFPDSFRLLCHNCNTAHSILGTCPHRTGPSLPSLYYHLCGRERAGVRCRLAIRRHREEAINAYGGKCACCGETEYEFLAIDHVAGGGRQHRVKLRADGIKTNDQFVCMLKSEGYPSEYRVLCHNCNFSLGKRGYCPHATAT